MKANRVKIFTTEELNGLFQIEEVLGVISEQIVIGANIFRDVFASWRDVFGGATKGYQKELNKLKSYAFQNIKETAARGDANAIIGLRLDFDEISGGGKSMFMLNLYGTAVKLSFGSEESILESEGDGVAKDEVNMLITKKKIINYINQNPDR